MATATGKEIPSDGGWAEVGVKATRIYSVYAVYTIDDPKDVDVPAEGRTKNRAWYLVHRFETEGPFLVGFDHLRWTTGFKGLARGTDNRVNVYVRAVRILIVVLIERLLRHRSPDSG